jgi:hypothetical protein
LPSLAATGIGGLTQKKRINVTFELVCEEIHKKVRKK